MKAKNLKYENGAQEKFIYYWNFKIFFHLPGVLQVLNQQYDTKGWQSFRKGRHRFLHQTSVYN